MGVNTMKLDSKRGAVRKPETRSTIGLRVSTKQRMDQCRAPGQCYDGFIQQMVEHWENSKD